MARIRTKARALDLLGRQQIAGIPTALNELFKNAHDAYADNVEVDYIRKLNLLILRDDGLGMTKEEFEERWLTIGTDSKLVDEDAIAQPVVNKNKKNRKIMGEKGVGRLSIATIGPQVLVLTRAKRDDKLQKLVVAFVNWTLFSFPSLDLEDIEVPIKELEDPSELNSKVVEQLKQELLTCVDSLTSKISSSKSEMIQDEINAFKYNPVIWNSRLDELDKNRGLDPSPMNILSNGSGTHFIISPTDDIIPQEIEESNSTRRTETASRLEKALLGFTNTMYAESNPPILARFRDHTLEGEVIDRISENQFFTPDEFNNADHQFEGIFNEFGQFEGTVSIYGTEHTSVVPWPDGRNKETLCGPFKLKLAYVQGMERDSTIPSTEWKLIRDKTDRIGGLYIYRDGIRILPYGDSDTDWLRMEQRRSKSAAEYFFSYRRMFGALELTKEINSKLREKAGREGFIENGAYKQLKAILEHFFIQLAADYFKEKGELSQVFKETRERQNQAHEALRKRAKLKTKKREKFQGDLNLFFEKLDKNSFDRVIFEHGEKLDKLFGEFEGSDTSVDDLSYKIERYLNESEQKLRKELSVQKPPGIGFDKEVMDAWDRYQVEKNKILLSFEEQKEHNSQKLIQFEECYGDRTGIRRRFSESIASLKEFQTKKLNNSFKEVEDSLNELNVETTSMLTKNKQMLKTAFDQVDNQFNSTGFANKNPQELHEIKKKLENEIQSVSEKMIEDAESQMTQIRAAKLDSEEHTINSDEMLAAIESEYEHLKEQHERNLEMVQLGMALGVVSHEFNSNINLIRRALSDMQAFARRNEKFAELYTKVRTGFDHLDGYLRTFTPLARRLSRKRTKISGRIISEFLSNVFDERLEKENIELTYTSSFLKQEVTGFTSTVFPSFINIIDNAIHWLIKSHNPGKISLDTHGKGFKIEDNGPGIPTIDQENVFEFGFSRRVGGQGMGLYVTKETLEKDGFRISLQEYSPGTGAVFTIEPVEEENDQE